MIQIIKNKRIKKNKKQRSSGAINLFFSGYLGGDSSESRQGYETGKKRLGGGYFGVKLLVSSTNNRNTSYTIFSINLT